MPDAFLTKLKNFVDSNLTWGATGMIVAGLGAYLSIIILIGLGWALLSISIWRARFFEAKRLAYQIVGNLTVCLVIAFGLILVFRFSAKARNDQPNNSDSTIINFQYDSTFTSERRLRITSFVNAYYSYFRNLGIPVVKETPPLGITDSTAIGDYSIASRPEKEPYDGSISVNRSLIDDQPTLAFVYGFVDLRHFVLRDPQLDRVEYENREHALRVLGSYFAASFLDAQGIELRQENWGRALWDVRSQIGREHTDKMLAYSVKSLSDKESDTAYHRPFNSYFCWYLALGELLANSRADIKLHIDRIMSQYNIPVDMTTCLPQ